MILNDNDYRNIASQIEEGMNSIDYDKDGEMLHIDCTFETEGYYEDDRCNGTGAWVETERNLCIESAETTDINGRTRAVDVDESLLESLVA